MQINCNNDANKLMQINFNNNEMIMQILMQINFNDNEMIMQILMRINLNDNEMIKKIKWNYNNMIPASTLCDPERTGP